MSRRADRLAIAAAVLGLLLATYARCSPLRPAHADTQTLRPGEQCVARPVDVPSLVVSAESAAKRLADAREVPRCRAALAECTRRVVRATSPEPTWRVAVRWVGVGLAMGASFYAGLKIGEAL